MGRRPTPVNPGDRYGHFTIVREADRKRYEGVIMRQFVVACSCGTQVTTTLNNLVRGRSTNCGCQRRYGRQMCKR